MKNKKSHRIIVNLVLICAMLLHCVLNIVMLANDTANNSAPAWTGAWVCLVYITVIIVMNAFLSVFAGRKLKE